MPWILANGACAKWWVVWLVFASWNRRSIIFCLLLYISFAMSSGLVNMLLDLSVMQSSGGDSEFLKTRLCILFGVMSYVCLHFDMAFLMLSFIKVVVTFLASL